jgi:predicted acetyltransferase
MPQLTAPDVRVHASYIAALEEFRAEGRGAPDDDSTAGLALREYGERWHDPAVFAEYVARSRTVCGPDAFPYRPDDGPCTNLWYVDGETYLGRLAIRHTLCNAFLRDHAGHIGYDIRPTARRRGHATAMLREALPVAARLGIDRALITCDTGNTASRRVIEAAGGVFDDDRGGVLRYWVPTDGSGTADGARR